MCALSHEGEKKNNNIAICTYLTRKNLLKVRNKTKQNKKPQSIGLTALKAMYIINNSTTIQPFVFPSQDLLIEMLLSQGPGRGTEGELMSWSWEQICLFATEYNSWNK